MTALVRSLATRGRGVAPLAVTRSYGIVVSFATLFVALSIASPTFLTTTNLLNVLDSWAPVFIVGAGVTVVLIGGGFDLSVAAVFSLAGVLAALVAEHASVALALPVGVLAGAVLGAINGLFVSVLRIHSFLATLASGLIVGGIGLLVTKGKVVSVADESFSTLGMGSALGIPYSIFLAVAVAAVVGLLLARTTFGDHVYAVGGNADAARVAGIRIGIVRTLTFTLSGATAGLAGVLAASRTSSGDIAAGAGLEFLAITAVVVGGTSIFGGEGALWRSAVGVLFLGIIGNGFNLLELDSVYEQVVNGAVILVAVAIDAWTRRRSHRT